MADGDTKRKGYQPRWAKCWDCGELMWKATARQTLCDKCREEHKKQYLQKQYQRAREQRARDKELLRRIGSVKVTPKVDEPSGGFEKHVCLVSGKCIYGEPGKSGCNYATVTGEPRSVGGKHRIREGKCDLYREERTGRTPGWMKSRDDAKKKRKERGNED